LVLYLNEEAAVGDQVSCGGEDPLSVLVIITVHSITVKGAHSGVTLLLMSLGVGSLLVHIALSLRKNLFS